MTSFKLNLISVKESCHDIFKKTLNITPVNITSFTVPRARACVSRGLCDRGWCSYICMYMYMIKKSLNDTLVVDLPF